MTLSMLVECVYSEFKKIFLYKILIKNTIACVHNLYISIIITRVKERTGPTDGLYKTSMRFTETWRLLYSGGSVGTIQIYV